MGYLRFYCDRWVNTSDDEIFVPEDTIRPVVYIKKSAKVTYA
jgi:hypothetical protein